MDCSRGFSLTLVLFFLSNIPSIAGRAPLITSLKADGSSGTVRITCAALGNPKPVVTWKFNNNELSESSRIEFRHDNKSMLVIKDTTDADSGKYRCVATNYFGSIYSDLDLRIKGIGEFEPGFQQDDECQSRNVTIGRPYVLNCPPHTKPYGQEYKWVVTPLEIWKAGYPLERIFTSPNGSLMFSFVKKSDISFINAKGGLSCGLVVDLQIVPSVSIKLVPNGPEFTGTAKPKIVSFMKQGMVAVKGNNVKLLCGAIGKPHPEFVWHKNGKPFYSSFKKPNIKGLTVEGKGLVLSFRSIQLTDAGKYKCFARNSAGSDSKEATLIVNAPVHWTKPLPIHNALPVRESIKLECKGSGKPLPTYKWIHNGTEIKSTTDRKINGGVLEIASVKFSDTGFYLCIAENYINSKVTAAFVDVRAFKPTFNARFEPLQYFITGKANTLFCDVTGGPLPLITWYHNDKPLNTHKAKLSFPSSSKEHKGVYKCKASNVKGDIEQSTTVEVYDPTVITIGPDNFSYPEGVTANLFCDATYDKELDVTFQWLREGKLITYDDRVQLKKGINWKTTGLQINKLISSDFGTYTCRVFTKDDKTFKSQDEKTGSITILAAPKEPQDVEVIGDCKAKTVKLSWSAPTQYVGPPAHYIVEYSSVKEKNNWFTLNEKVTETFYHIDTNDLPPSANLVFRVKAVAIIDGEKKVGKACPETKAGDCIVADGNPVAPPMGLKAVVDDNENVVVSWDKFDEIMKPDPKFRIIAEVKKKVNGTLVDTKKIQKDGDATSVTIESKDDKKNKNDDIEYEIKVYGENDKGAGPAETVYVKNPSNLVLPTLMNGIKVVSVTSDSVTLEWNEISTATGYMMYYTPVSSTRRKRSLSKDTKSQKAPAGKTGKIDGLQPNQKYKVSVSALNMRGEGPKSEPIEVNTKKGAPGKPKDVDLKTFGQAIVLEWSPSKDAKDHEVTWYPSSSNDPAKKKTKTVPTNGTQAIIDSDLEPLKYYTVELRARNDQGKGKPWKMVGVVVGKKDVPGKPGKPLAEPLNGTAIKVTFKLPDDSHGGLPKKYHVYHKKQKAPAEDAKKTSADYPETPSVLLTDLELAIYEIWTVAENSEGIGDKSDVVTEMPKPPTTRPPTVVITTAAPVTRNITSNDTFVLPVINQDDATEFYNELWFIILLAIILLIIIILLLICAILNKSGGKYPVGDKEKKFGGWDNQQLQDYSDNPMEKTNGLPFKDTPKRSASVSSISKPIIDDNDDPDNDSLDFYSEDNKFNEDGSFIGEYGDDKKSMTNDSYYS